MAAFCSHLQLACESLHRNRGRSFLTCLGIAIGVASITLILSLMGSAGELIAAQTTSVGNDLIVVRPATHKDETSGMLDELISSNSYLDSNLTAKDVEALKAMENVSAVVPISVSYNTLSAEHTVESGTVLGTNADLPKIQNFSLKNGTFLSDENQKNTAVLGKDLSISLFNTTSAVGQTFSLLGQKFIVIGVLDEVDNSANFNGVNLNNVAIVNTGFLATIKDVQVQQINIRASSTDLVPEVASNAIEVLKSQKSGDSNFSVMYGGEITHPAQNSLKMISAMLAVVACVSLVVGGIGIMNIMLVSVAERTHEIGVRKAVGASTNNILLQFLLEALILSLLGGILGLALGYILAFLISLVTPFAPFVSLPILATGILASIFIGTIFGLYPAIKAARKNPIDSLKHYR